MALERNWHTLSLSFLFQLNPLQITHLISTMIHVTNPVQVENSFFFFLGQLAQKLIRFININFFLAIIYLLPIIIYYYLPFLFHYLSRFFRQLHNSTHLKYFFFSSFSIKKFTWESSRELKCFFSFLFSDNFGKIVINGNPNLQYLANTADVTKLNALYTI